MRAVLFVALILISAPLASAAWIIDTGTTLSQPGTLFTIGPTITVPIDANLTFTTDARKSPVLNGIEIDMVPQSGSWSWSIMSWTQANISVAGNNAKQGSMHVSGLESISYNVLGVIGTPTFTEIGPEFEFDVPQGNQQIYILPATRSDAALRVDAGYSWANGTIHAVVSLRGIDGGAAGGEAANINVSVYLPNGETGHINLTETDTVGVYRGALNVTMSPLPAPYVVTAQFDELTDGVVVIVTENIAKTIRDIGVSEPVNVSLQQSAASEMLPMLAFLVVIIGLLILGMREMPIFAFIGAILSVVAVFVSVTGDYQQVWRWVFIALALINATVGILMAREG